jgi:hypothetical protein
MKYMVLLYNDPALEPAYGTPEFQSMMMAFGAANEQMAKGGVLLHGDGLQDVETATSLRIRGGKTETMDGPFAETKERLGGYYILDCKDLDEALKYAALLPSATFGTVEVRPLADYGI